MDKDFNKIYCINLDKRKDRWVESLSEFKKNGIENVERFSAIDGDILKGNFPIKNGAYALILTVRKIINEAKNKGYKNIFIFEDDVEFHQDFNNLYIDFINKINKNLPEWDMLYFGGNHQRPLNKTNIDNIYKLTGTFATHALALNESVYDLLLNYIKEPFNRPLDIYYSELHKVVDAYVYKPHIAWQRESFSDIEKANTNYTFLK